MADPLAAAGMILAALALVYSAWNGSIQAEIDRSYSPNDAARATEKAASRRVRDWRARPLGLACLTVLIAFAARDLKILCSVRRHWLGEKSHYDDVAAVFLLTQIFLLGLMCHVALQSHRITKRL